MSAGDTTALSVLYDRYAARLFGLASKILNDGALAEDVVQELFMHFWQQSAGFDQRRGQPLPWMMVLCRNRCIDKLRSLKSSLKRSSILEENLNEFVTNESADPLEHVKHKELQATIAAALEQLPDEQRVPIELSYFEGLSQTEIADRLQAPLGTVKTRVRLGMQKLRNLMIKAN